MVSLVDIHINRSDKIDADIGDEAFCLPIAAADQAAELVSEAVAPDSPSPDSVERPAPVGRDERRLQVRAHNHWLSLASGLELPAVEDLHLDQIGEMASQGVMLDLTLGAASPTIIFLGEKLAEECGESVELFSIGDVPNRSLLRQLTDHCLEVAASRAPVGFDVGFSDRSGCPILARGILLPFSSNGKVADFIFGVISWKEDTGPAIARTSVGLPTLLRDARQSALLAGAGERRSREAYYSAISAAYDFSRAALSNPFGLAQLLTSAGLTHSDRAPLVPVARLVFGPDYDKTRIAEITAALALGHRRGLERGKLGAVLHDTAGGLKALVTEQRQFRRMASGETPDRPRSFRPALAVRLRNLSPISPDNQIESGEFALLVARRDFAGRVTLIGDLSANPQLLEAAARRLLAL
jgi:hypothetical protein